MRKRHFLAVFILKTNILPRQARDKHRKNSKKVPFSCSSYVPMDLWWSAGRKDFQNVASEVRKRKELSFPRTFLG